MAKGFNESRDVRLNELCEFLEKKPGDNKKPVDAKKILTHLRQIGEVLKPLEVLAARSYLAGGSKNSPSRHRSKGKGR